MSEVPPVSGAKKICCWDRNSQQNILACSPLFAAHCYSPLPQMKSSRNKGIKLNKRVPCSHGGPDWMRVMTEGPNGVRFCKEYYSPKLKRIYYGLNYLVWWAYVTSNYRGKWLFTWYIRLEFKTSLLQVVINFAQASYSTSR